ncbi:two pore potassium channel protein sup-9 [Episyrphus balteatus]|uniref:two pore potassium channel protein sup-9 n=1 Tax=Episyrphus balteatus TaxID=286459 RepID=UPI002485C627|nr:two pore potassium channel protein sup-9 [Episyrphus balteatus]
MSRKKHSFRSQNSSSSLETNPRKRVGRCCRKFVAFMCTQVGVGALIVVYAICGAFSFTAIETQYVDESSVIVRNLRNNFSEELWMKTETLNLFNRTLWETDIDKILKRYQYNITQMIKKGYDGRTPQQIWSFPAALMFCLSVFTMIGYGNMVPRTPWGKGFTVIYATLGIPLYILYFLNMGKVLAKSFKFLYRGLHECTQDSDELESGVRKKIIVPSTACLWVIMFYILTGTVMFANWEHWFYLDSFYFCMTSLCKIGFGDFVPGASIHPGDVQTISDLERDQQTKLAINFLYMLIGMGLVAMCYNLMREEVRVKMQEIKEDMNLCLEDMRSRSALCCGRDSYDEESYY